MGFRLLSAVALALLCFVSACASKNDAKPSASTGLHASDEMLATMLGARLKLLFGEWKEPAAENVLSGLVAKVRPNSKPVRISLLATHTPLVLVGPARNIFVSRGAIEGAEFENEIVFPLAAALELIDRGIPMKRYEAMAGGGEAGKVFEGQLFEYGGYYDFGAQVYQDADVQALAKMHERKYDHRGAVALLKHWISGSMGISLSKLWKIDPVSEERFKTVREESGKIQPLRDPVIKGRVFEDLKAKLRKNDARKSA